MLMRICHLKLTHLPWEGLEDTHLTTTLKHTFAREASAPSVIILLHRPNFTVGSAVVKLRNINTVGLIGS